MLPSKPSSLKRISLAAVWVGAAMWLPFAWVVLMDYSWDSYRMTWVRMWTVLPGIYVGFFFHPNESQMMTMMLLTTVAMFGSLVWLGSRGPRRLVAAVVIALCICVPESLGAYSLFWV
ncbi:MAG: hypothetical protein AAGG38_05930 [Planctomycetota bacterium]